MFSSLTEVRERVTRWAPDPATLRMINVRIILRTGVNLLEPKLAHERDRDAIAKVVLVLRDLGYDVVSNVSVPTAPSTHSEEP